MRARGGYHHYRYRPNYPLIVAAALAWIVFAFVVWAAWSVAAAVLGNLLL